MLIYAKIVQLTEIPRCTQVEFSKIFNAAYRHSSQKIIG